MKILSHPDKELIKHLDKVKEIGLKVFNEKDITLPDEYNKDNLRKALEIILWYHDFGKATKYFQEYLKANIEDKKCDIENSFTHHALISACIASYKVYISTKNTKLALFAFLSIRKHHGNFENLDEMLVVSKNDWNILERQWNNILGEFKNILNGLDFSKIKGFIEDLLWETENFNNLNDYVVLNFIFSILIYSDKTEVVFGDILKQKELQYYNLINEYKETVFKTAEKNQLNNLRDEIYKTSLYNLLRNYQNHKIFSLNVPTGSGKTLTALNLALNLLKKDNSLKRVIYALPFTSIIDQTAKILQDIFKINELNSDDFLIVHHHLADLEIKNNEDYFEGNKAQFLIENWDKPLILTTFWQLFNSIITGKNSQLRKFHNITNSIIILDEVQTIPYKYWLLVKELFSLLTEYFNCRILFLTATMPLIFQEEKGEIFPLIEKEQREKYFKMFSRYKLNFINNGNDIDLANILSIAKSKINGNKEKDFLFVFNTIKTSINFFKELKNKFPDEKLIYLSTNILPVDRKQRIDEIKNSKRRKIVVSTQIIEAGMDIDFDIVFRDFAILDSIVQTAGRCNRNNKIQKGQIYLFKYKNENDRNDFKYIYQGLPLLITKDLIEEQNSFEENQLLLIIGNYYNSIKDRISNDESKNILKNLTHLNYENIYNEFKLIENIPSILLFIEINNEAEEVLRKFKDIVMIENMFERKNELLKIKKDFYKYTLSVKATNNNIKFLESFDEIGNLKILNSEMCGQYYSNDIGLNLVFDNFL